MSIWDSIGNYIAPGYMAERARAPGLALIAEDERTDPSMGDAAFGRSMDEAIYGPTQYHDPADYQPPVARAPASRGGLRDASTYGSAEMSAMDKVLQQFPGGMPEYNRWWSVQDKKPSNWTTALKALDPQGFGGDPIEDLPLEPLVSGGEGPGPQAAAGGIGPIGSGGGQSIDGMSWPSDSPTEWMGSYPEPIPIEDQISGDTPEMQSYIDSLVELSKRESLGRLGPAGRGGADESYVSGYLAAKNPYDKSTDDLSVDEEQLLRQQATAQASGEFGDSWASWPEDAPLSDEEKAQAARSALTERAKAKQQAEKNLTQRMNEINNK